ncbi:gas vesicle protein GvpL [Halomarina ordinaria]|uniref:Gas vesicle protein GvpL n=1 Tax=Halomarina ordinaria TaxID=3033939 RepID=A0ABD5U4X3_9EURY|nr:GvpL/GvpF family gas vesicle protein [Halomarina sp. PSRA2]
MSEEGRYLYCAVAVPDGPARRTLDVEGIDGDPVSLLADDGVGVVVHERAEQYDSEDAVAVQRWLLAHQRVIDAVGQEFGTPLPFRFDTLLAGDDDDVFAWLADERETLAEHLADLADHWEYRIEVRRDPEAFEAAIVEADPELAALHERVESAGGGTAHLLEKQYEGKLREAKRAHGDDRTEELLDRVRPHAREVRALSRRPQTGGLVERESDAVTLARLAMLATEDGASAAGEELDEVAADPGVEVRYTGPWPPYTFAPAIGEEGEEGEESEGDTERGDPDGAA